MYASWRFSCERDTSGGAWRRTRAERESDGARNTWVISVERVGGTMATGERAVEVVIVRRGNPGIVARGRFDDHGGTVEVNG